MKIECSGLSKTYDGEAWAVRDVDLTIARGSVVGLIGPNGAGKSTALRMIATATDPSCGTILYDGRPAPPRETPEAAALRGRIGFLGDGDPLYTRMTPREYLRLFGQCFGLRGVRLDRAIEHTLHTFDLRGKADTPAGALSKGMRQRLLIARCLLHEPSLLLLDEPADGLDPRGRADLRARIAETAARGVTVIISSHILRELDELCDTIAILQKGRLVVGGAIPEIIARYEVARFAYEVRALDGAAAAASIVARHRARIEHERQDGSSTVLRIRILTGSQDDAKAERAMADLLGELVAGGVSIVTVSRQQSRLEDVYDRLSENRVN